MARDHEMIRYSWRVAILFHALAFACLAQSATFSVTGTDEAPWLKLLGAVGLTTATPEKSDIVVLGARGTADPHALAAAGKIVIVEGTDKPAQQLGIVAESAQPIEIRRIIDPRAPDQQIIWETPVSVPQVKLPDGFQIFATEKWHSAPVLAGKRDGEGAILWLATSPGSMGYERYPYLIQALQDLGLRLPVRATNLWAFFDSSYRIRADVDYLAKRWRQSGISVLHVAAWHAMEGDPTQDEYVKALIAACHRNAIVVYAWLELPHVSQRFWNQHPEWREKTAAGQDAELDWRKLMNLQNVDCRRAVQTQIADLIRDFDWDGVNLAELYFESLEGASNPARFTPMNNDVRNAFKASAGFDPALLFDASSQYSKNQKALRAFLTYRSDLAAQMQSEWLGFINHQRSAKPYLDLVLTHIDDRFDTSIRDALGADVARSLPLLQKYRATLLIEDPATLWNLGPERYAKLGRKYAELSPDARQFAVDINVVNRYQDVYPTKKQTGLELLELIHEAAASFSRVALYFENSLEKQDLELIAVAANTASTKRSARGLTLQSNDPIRVQWSGPAMLDGKIWPLQSTNSVLVPAGKHELTSAANATPVVISDFNGEIQAAHVRTDAVEIAYTARTRAIVILGTDAATADIDGVPLPVGNSKALMLPAGQHVVTFGRSLRP